MLNDGSEAGMWITATNKSYDFAYTRDHTGASGRFHHVTYALNSREEMLLAADIFLENGVFIETGPHKHAIQQTFFLYVYEPGGNRVEVAMPRRQVDPGAGLEADHLDRGRAQEGPGLGPADHRVVPYPRHAGDTGAGESVSATSM